METLVSTDEYKCFGQTKVPLTSSSRYRRPEALLVSNTEALVERVTLT